MGIYCVPVSDFSITSPSYPSPKGEGRLASASIEQPVTSLTTKDTKETKVKAKVNNKAKVKNKVEIRY